MPDKSLSRTCVPVSINKPLHRRVIIPASEIVKSRLAIVVVPTIPNRVQIRNISAYGKNITPSVIGIGAVALAPLGAAGGLDLRHRSRNVYYAFPYKKTHALSYCLSFTRSQPMSGQMIRPNTIASVKAGSSVL